MFLVKIIPLLNRVLLGSSVFVVAYYFFFSLASKESDSIPKRELPHVRFPEEPLLELGPVFALKPLTMNLSLSNLNRELYYIGINQRPDQVESSFFFTLNNEKKIVSCLKEERFYLTSTGLSQSEMEGERLIEFFVLEENPLGVSVEARLCADKTQVVCLQLPLSHLHDTPLEYRQLTVDTSTLSRQEACWYGPDLFLKEHGGTHYSHLSEKQRIEFDKGAYTCFLGEKEGAIWDQGRWKVVSLGQQSQGFPLLYLQKVEDNLLHFDLWDVQGLKKTSFILVNSSESLTPPQGAQELQLLSVRSFKHCLLDIQGETLVVKPKDWLLLTEGRWKRLTTGSDIERYVANELKGDLMVLDRLVKRKGVHVLIGHLFNKARTIKEEIEIKSSQEVDCQTLI